MSGGILIINAGSSSLKFSLFSVAAASLTLKTNGQVEGIGTQPHFIAKAAGTVLAEQHWSAEVMDQEALLEYLLGWIRDYLGEGPLRAVGHRVVFGGEHHRAPLQVNAEVMTRLTELIPLMPLHLPVNLAPIEAISRVHPDLPQVICFDTAFHHTIPRLARLYALPRALTEEGLRGYGFHGLSYEYIVSELRRIDPGAAAGRTVVAHLGSGASLCALVSGQSVACTLGFGALDGLVMGTRPGRLDPGILLYLLQARGMDAKALEQLLYQESGLLGVSGISNDMRDLQASDSPHAREAIDLFIYRAARELGSMVAAAGGLDALVFTAGIGEHDPQVRAGICAQSAWLGIKLDIVANRNGNSCISSPDSTVRVWVIPTNEERMIALHTLHTLGEPA
jgi:acetate kinase